MPDRHTDLDVLVALSGEEVGGGEVVVVGKKEIELQVWRDGGDEEAIGILVDVPEGRKTTRGENAARDLELGELELQ
jgi:hypothetical protein